MDIRNIKNWKENPKYQEIKLRMQDVKVKKTFRWIFEIAVTLAFAALTAVLMFQTVTMQESAMEPTIEVGDSFFMNRVIYKFSSPKRGDIIVFRTDASDDAGASYPACDRASRGDDPDQERKDLHRRGRIYGKRELSSCYQPRTGRGKRRLL